MTTDEGEHLHRSYIRVIRMARFITVFSKTLHVATDFLPLDGYMTATKQRKRSNVVSVGDTRANIILVDPARSD